MSHHPHHDGAEPFGDERALRDALPEARAGSNELAGADEAIKVLPDEDLATGGVDSDDQVVPARKRKNVFLRALDVVVPPGGLIASSFTLGSSTLGAGIMGLAATFNSMGLGTAILILVVCVLLTIFSLWLLGIVAHKTGIRTYSDNLRVLLGRGAGWFGAVLLIINCLGGGVSYVISIMDIFRNIFEDKSTPAYLRTNSGKQLMTALVFLVFIYPLCLLRHIDSLRHGSLLGVFFMLFFVLCMIIMSGIWMRKNGWRSDLVYFNTGNDVSVNLGTILFACQVQMNAFEVYYEMDVPSPGRMLRNSTVAMAMVGILYALAGIVGYGRFGTAVKGSILLEFKPREEPVFWVCYFGVIFKLCVAFVLHQIPMRDAVYHFLKWDVYKMPWWRNAVMCTIFCTVMLVLGLFIPKVNVVLGLTGSLCGAFVGFIFPSLMYMYTGNWTFRSKGAFTYIMTYFLLLVGAIALCFGTIGAIYGVIPGRDGSAF